MAERLAPAVADRVPVRLRTVVAPSRPGLAGLVLLVTVAVAVAGAVLAMARPEGEPVPARRPVGRPVAVEPAAEPSAAASATSGPVFVHVAGSVRRPGLVELPAGSRVADAVEAAGGLTRRADPASVNLARPLVDGEQLVVLRRGASPVPGAAGLLVAPGAVAPGATAGPGGSVPGSPTGAPVDLNSATLDQLDALPGIGPVLAQRILDWRTQNGRFTSVEELGEVSGIGEATLGDIRDLVTVVAGPGS